MNEVVATVCCDWLNQMAGTPVGRATYKVRTVIECSRTYDHIHRMQMDEYCCQCGLDYRDILMARPPRLFLEDQENWLANYLFGVYLKREQQCLTTSN